MHVTGVTAQEVIAVVLAERDETKYYDAAR